MAEFQGNNRHATACVIHCRVSTQKQAYEGESLDVQASICSRIAENKGWVIAHEPWKESFSGRKHQRPVFDDVLAFLDAHPGRVRYYLFRSIDRFTRGGTGAYDRMKRELAKRNVELVDSLGLIQPIKNTLEHLGFEYDWSMVSPSEISEVVTATTAKQEVSTILTRLIGEEIALRQRGYKIRGPADGFVNAKISVGGRKRTIERPDPERAKYFVAMFEMRASGRYTDAEICERLNAMGYRSKRQNRWNAEHTAVIGTTGGAPLISKRLQEVVRRPIYCGVICEKWTRWLPVQAAYPGLVSIETFNAANRGAVHIRTDDHGQLEILYDYQPEKAMLRLQKNNPLFPFRKVIVCPHCRKFFHGSSPTGCTGRRFPTYHCARNHRYYGIKKAIFESTVSQYIDELRFAPEARLAFEPLILQWYDERKGELAEATKRVAIQADTLELQKAETIKAFKAANSETVRRALEAEAEDYDRQIGEARSVQYRMAISRSEVSQYLDDVEKILELPSILLKDPANPLEQQALYSLVFPEPPSYEEISLGTAKLDWIFYLSSGSETMESAQVRLRGLQWNSIENSILRWKQNKPLLETALDNETIAHSAHTSPQSPQVPSD